MKWEGYDGWSFIDIYDCIEVHPAIDRYNTYRQGQRKIGCLYVAFRLEPLNWIEFTVDDLKGFRPILQNADSYHQLMAYVRLYEI